MVNFRNAQLSTLPDRIPVDGSAPSTAKGNWATINFQELMQQSSGKVSSQSKGKDVEEKPVKDQQEGQEMEEIKLPVQNKKGEEELKPEILAANPNAVNIMNLFRPEIVETTDAPVDTVVNPVPEEAVQETAMDLDGQMPEMETSVESGIGAEVSMEQQPKDFSQSLEEAPARETAQQPVQVQQESAPERHVEQVDKPDLPDTVEVKAESRDDGEEFHGEVMVEEQPVFHETHSIPVKVGERYETVDTQKPDMDKQLANTIRNAAQAGSERIEIRLAPQNLGNLVIEMARDTNGALQVVLHTSNTRAAGVLNQHLDGLHTALQGYGHEEVRVEVQRGQESQEQHFKQADPDGRGQQQHRQQQERQEDAPASGQEFLQKLRLGLFGTDDL